MVDGPVISKTQKHERWPEEKANAWGAQQPWIVGCNYIPVYASNPIEMWRKETFDATQIKKEMGWMQKFGYKGARTFLSDLAYEEDPENFLQNVDEYLDIADGYGVLTTFVCWDGVWKPDPKKGPQPRPKKGVHNAGWVQSPGRQAMEDDTQRPRLKEYVQTVVARYAHDPRVRVWDVFNEPDNMNSYLETESPYKVELAAALLEDTFEWMREINPDQPLTSGIWKGDWRSESQFNEVEKLQVAQSDIITFHCYEPGYGTNQRIKQLRRYNRPLECTENIARHVGCTFAEILPVYKQEKVASFAWGFVNGRTQTKEAWDNVKQDMLRREKEGQALRAANNESISTPRKQANLWFHDAVRKNGKAYSHAEAEFIKNITGVGKAPADWQPSPLQFVEPKLSKHYTI